MNLKVLLKNITILIFSILSCTLHAQVTPRTVVNWNGDWQFTKDSIITKQTGWKTLQLPHTWNAEDVMDDEPGYHRGACWYKKTFRAESAWKHQQLSLYFEGVNQETEVYVNGKKAGSHIGGYTGFSIPMTSHLKWGDVNEILVRVNNKHNENIAPLSADFTFYGGIYRDVFLVSTAAVHFSDTAFGSGGVFISTPEVSAEKAVTDVKSHVRNATARPQKLTITTTLFDADGRAVSQLSKTATLKAFSAGEVSQRLPSVIRPRLWSPEHPYLYTAETKITDAAGKLLDVVKNKIGFRWYSIDADKGFFLNGQPYKIIGASRHQDYAGLGNAVPDELALNDMALLKNMGANFLRVAHYPQDPSVLRACDSLGLLASVEIPVVNEITESEAFYSNCERMQTEMIRQNFNHPSVIMWCYMNEVLLRPHFPNDKERQKEYFANINKLAQRLEALTRKADPYRYTMMANHGNLNQYKTAGLLSIPMVVGWNLYSGWYGGNLQDFPNFLDEFHKNYPDRPFMVTEYGADADPRIRSLQPVRFDKSIEYTTAFHQFYFTEMMKRSYVSGMMIWNLADFNSETRTETMPHINNKGLLEWDRKPKDPYFFYQAVLSKQPFVKLLGSCENKFGIADSSSAVCYQWVQVASNLDSVTIKLNGNTEVKLKINDGLCQWKLPFRQGNNTVVVEGKEGRQLYADTISTQIQLQPHCLTDNRVPFEQINIMLGSARYFTDEKGLWWQPDQVYQKGRWGSVGGKKFKVENNGRLPYGTDKNIRGTNDDPIYQTQQTGIQQYRLDVPPGNYEVVLHFAELLGGKVTVPPYNLSEDGRSEKGKRRVFNVNINGKPVLRQFNIADDYGLAKAITKSATVTVQEGEGVYIDFVAVEGEPVLNALQLKKLETDILK